MNGRGVELTGLCYLHRSGSSWGSSWTSRTSCCRTRPCFSTPGTCRTYPRTRTLYREGRETASGLRSVYVVYFLISWVISSLTCSLMKWSQFARRWNSQVTISFIVSPQWVRDRSAVGRRIVSTGTRSKMPANIIANKSRDCPWRFPDNFRPDEIGRFCWMSARLPAVFCRTNDGSTDPTVLYSIQFFERLALAAIGGLTWPAPRGRHLAEPQI